MAELNDKQKAFCDEYMKDFNGTRAAMVVGYSQKNAKVSATRLLSSAYVQAYLAEKKQVLAEKTEITREMVINGYKNLAFFDVRKFYDKDGYLKKVVDLDDETAFALAGMDVSTTITDFGVRINTNKIKMSDRKGALDSICKMLGYNAPDKVANTDPEGNTVQPTQLLTDKQFDTLIEAINKL